MFRLRKEVMLYLWRACRLANRKPGICGWGRNGEGRAFDGGLLFKKSESISS